MQCFPKGASRPLLRAACDSGLTSLGHSHSDECRYNRTRLEAVHGKLCNCRVNAVMRVRLLHPTQMERPLLLSCAEVSFAPRHTSSSSSRSAFLPLACVKGEPVVLSRERNLRSLGKIEHVTLGSVHLLPSLIRDVKRTLKDDLHLMVGVFIYKRRA